MNKPLFNLPQIIELAAHQWPNKKAFASGPEHLSYQELDVQTNQLANFLINQGIKKGDRVGILLPRSLASVISVYGVLKSGAAYVPMDPNAPAQRNAFVLKDCGIKILITDHKCRRLIHNLSKSDTNVALLIGNIQTESFETTSWEFVAGEKKEAPSIKILADDLAYVMYTSGSTGMPKGIMHTHYSGLSYAKLSNALYEIHDKDIVANHCALHYDISTFGYFAAPLSGATICILTDALTKIPASLSAYLQDEQITIWYSVPLALSQLLTHGGLENKDLKLRWILFGGETFVMDHLRQFMQLFPAVRFSNVYGPAEVNQCTYYHVDKIPSEESQQIPIGHIWDNSDFLIMDEQERPVEDNAKGELYIRSATMMQAYWNQPTLTQQKIYLLTDNSGLSKRYYKSGDLVSMENGLLYFHGRIDRQVKINGFRVELEAVENIAQSYHTVQSAAVFVQRKHGVSKLICAITARPLELIVIKDLHRYLKQSLPGHAVPKLIFEVEKIPRTGAGKTDYGALLKMTEEQYG